MEGIIRAGHYEDREDCSITQGVLVKSQLAGQEKDTSEDGPVAKDIDPGVDRLFGDKPARAARNASTPKSDRNVRWPSDFL